MYNFTHNFLQIPEGEKMPNPKKCGLADNEIGAIACFTFAITIGYALARILPLIKFIELRVLMGLLWLATLAGFTLLLLCGTRREAER